MKDCPICKGQHDRIDLSLNVCKFHESYFVIVCGVCGKAKFSDNASICINCAGKCDTHFQNGYNRDHRFYLKLIGQEGSPTRGL